MWRGVMSIDPRQSWLGGVGNNVQRVLHKLDIRMPQPKSDTDVVVTATPRRYI